MSKMFPAGLLFSSGKSSAGARQVQGASSHATSTDTAVSATRLISIYKAALLIRTTTISKVLIASSQQGLGNFTKITSAGERWSIVLLDDYKSSLM